MQKTFLRDLCIVARNDFLDSLRSRRIVVWLTLYLLGALGGCSIFTYVVHQIESEIARTVHLAETKKAGALTSSLWESNSFKNIMTEIVGDKELAEKLLQTPPIALFFGWISMSFGPLLVILLSSESISSEVWSKSARYSLFRTSKLSWASGKFLGQALILFLAFIFSGIGAWISGRIGFSTFEPIRAMASIFEMLLKAWLYGLAFMGVAFGVSQITRSVQVSRGLGILAYFFLGIISQVADHFSGDGWRQIWELVLMLIPQGHKLDLWRPEWSHQIGGAAFCIALAFLYFLAGYAVFSRRDI